jgi:hypothetical protein
MWIKQQIDTYIPTKKVHNPRPITLVCDATFYAKRKDKIGTLVFLDSTQKEVLLWKHIESETVKEYKDLKQQLVKLGYTIQSVSFDGKKGLPKLFKDYPVQMCHFHQKKIIQRYITKYPRLQAGKDLKKIMYNLTTTTKGRFTKKLDEWYKVYGEFIQETTVNKDTGECFWTHQKVRAAYRSLRANIDTLFTYKDYKDFIIPTTTNNLDGGTFSPMKKLINIHTGISKKLRFKLVDEYLGNYKRK